MGKGCFGYRAHTIEERNWASINMKIFCPWKSTSKQWNATQEITLVLTEDSDLGSIWGENGKSTLSWKAQFNKWARDLNTHIHEEGTGVPWLTIHAGRFPSRWHSWLWLPLPATAQYCRRAPCHQSAAQEKIGIQKVASTECLMLSHHRKVQKPEIEPA